MNSKTQNVPTKYNGDLLDDVFMFTIDFLIVNLKGVPSFKDSNGFKFQLDEYGTKIFSHKIVVSIDNKAFGTMLMTPRSSILKEDLIQFKFENALFYTHTYFDLKQYLFRMMNHLDVEFEGVNRLDLAIDYQDDQEITVNLIKDLSVNNFRISGRKKDFKLFSETHNGNINYTGIQVGSRSSSRFLRVYDKSLEITRGKYKGYIVDAWKSVGIEKNVWRYEYQLNNKFLTSIRSLNEHTLFDKEFLISLLEISRKNHFEIKHNTGKSEINKEKTLDYMDIPTIRKAMQLVTVPIEKIVRTINESLIGQKRMIKGLMRSYCSRLQNASYLAPLKLMLNDFDLKEWFYSRFSYYLDEFKRSQIIKSFDYKKFTKDLELCA